MKRVSEAVLILSVLLGLSACSSRESLSTYRSLGGDGENTVRLASSNGSLADWLAICPDKLPQYLYNPLSSSLEIDGADFFDISVCDSLIQSSQKSIWADHLENILSREDSSMAKAWNCYRDNMWLLLDDQSIESCLFGQSEVEFDLGDSVLCKVEQATQYPADNIISYTFSFTRNGKSVGRHELEFIFRIPSWATGVNVRINGKISPYLADDKSRGHIDRKFRSGDEISLTFDFPDL